MLSNSINLRKIGIMFLIFTLAFTGMGLSLGTPVSYAAEEGTYVSEGGNDTTGDGTRENPYKTLQKAFEKVTTEGTIYLLDDITLESVGTSDTGILINEAKRVTISTAPGVEKIAMIKRVQPTGYMKVLFQLNNMSQLTLKNIIIDGNLEVKDVDGRLFNVYGGSTLIIDEGAILQNSNSRHPGSAIYINKTGSVVKMEGGEISGNKSSLSSMGAAVFAESETKFIMTGGLITDNTGGGVESRGGQISLSGDAVITGNINSAGKEQNVNLVNYQALVLAGEFSGKAGITTQSMTPGTKFGRVTDDGLGSIDNLIADSGSLVASYDENKTLLWRSFKNEISQPSTDGEIVAKRPTLKGVTEPNATVKIEVVSAKDQSLVITEEVTADANGNWALPVSKALEIGKYTIKVIANKEKTQSEPVTRPFEVGNGVYVASYGKDTTGDGSPGNPYATLKKAYEEANNGGTIYVLDDIELIGFGVNGTKSITISTAPEVETAVIKRGKPSGAIETLFGLTQKGQLTLKNIIIDGGFENNVINGRIINVYDGSKLIIEEGTILRNSNSQYHGSAIQVKDSGSVVEMTGGEIRGNQLGGTSGIVAPGLGGAVLVDSGTKFIMTGGQITDNIGGGVQSRGGEIFLSGNVRITGNMNEVSGKSTNVYLPSSDRFTLDGAFTGEAGITASGFMKDGGQFGKAVAGDLDGIENLIADEGPLLSSYGANNTLVWRLFKNELSQPSSDGEKTGTNPTLSGVTEPLAKVMIKIVSATDPSLVILNEERTADENGNWELPINEALDKGAYTITVTASKNKTQSDTVIRQFEVVATPLAVPSNVKVTGDQLTWDAVENAESYEVSITDSEGKVTRVTVPSGTTLDLSTLEPSLAPGEYTLTVTAKSNNPAYTDSQASESVTYTTSTTATPLAVPSNVKVTGDQLTWDAVENAESYEVNITDSEGNVTPVTVPSGTTLDLSTLEPSLAPGEYTLTVTAKSSNPAYTDSQASESVTYTTSTTATPLAVPSNVKVTGDQLTWDAVENAESYEVNITDSEGNVTPVTVPSGTTLDLSTLEPSLAPGEYTLTVTAKSSNPAYTDSQASESVTYTVPNGSEEVNKTKLQAEVDRSKELTETDYTEASWAAYKEKLTAAQAVLDKEDATQEEVEAAYKALKSAKDALEEITAPGVDKTALEQKAEEINDKIATGELTKSKYTSESWTNLELALTEADRVLKDPNATKADVDQALSKLQKALKDLVVLNGDNPGGGSTGGGNSGTENPTTPPTTDNTVKPGNIVTIDNGSNVSFASGTVNGDQATVTIDKDKLSGILADGKGHKLGIRVPGKGDAEVRGLTLGDLKKLADNGSSLEIEDVLAIYPIPAGQLDVNAISKQFGNAPISDIAANIKIKRSADDLAKVAREKATQGGYELLVHPVDLDLTFMHDGKTDRAGLLNGYAPKYIALPEGIDPNRITTGVIINPDGSVFHVPTVVTKIDNRYFALINDLRSSGTYSVIWNPQDFEDVQYHWGRADVNNIAARLDLKGNGDNTFSPNRYVTRSEFAEIIVLGLGLMRQDAPQNIFPDVPASAWYRNAVALADEFGIVQGYTDGDFKGGQEITREQGFAMIARAYRLIQSEGMPNQERIASTLAPYADGENVAAWAKADVAQLIAAGIIQGNGPKLLSPKAEMTRAEVTALIARMLKVTNLIDK